MPSEIQFQIKSNGIKAVPQLQSAALQQPGQLKCTHFGTKCLQLRVITQTHIHRTFTRTTHHVGVTTCDCAGISRDTLDLSVKSSFKKKL